jgi:hypothetical protein
MMDLFVKDPGEAVDWTFDWDDAYLTSGETIDASDWAVEPTGGITLSGDDFTGSTTTVTASGGTSGATYRLVNTVTTSLGRTVVRSVTVRVTPR